MPPKKKQGRRDFGSIRVDKTKTRTSYSAVWWEGAVQKRKRGFTTSTAAGDHLALVRLELRDGAKGTGDPDAPAGVMLEHAIDLYGKHLAEEGVKDPADRLYRLTTFFPDSSVLLADLTKDTCEAYYTALRARVSRTGKPFAVDSHRSMLAEARMMAKWCVKKGWLKVSPLEGVEGLGKRRHGKPQLRIDEARKWMAKATELADTGETGAVAAMMSLLLGMRAGEIVSRVVRDLDDEGRLLWIPDSKTEAGKRTLQVPGELQPYLEQLAAGKGPQDRLFGHHWRDWIRDWVRKICKAAGVPMVGAHSMRGLHSTLALEHGASAHVVASSLGHESITTTLESYARPGAGAGARQQRTLKVLQGGSK